MSDLETVARLAERMEPAMRRAFLAAVRGTAGMIDLAVLADAVRGGAMHEVDAAAMFDHMSHDMRQRFLPLLGRSFAIGVAAGAVAIDSGETYGLDPRAAEAVAWVRQRGANLVVSVTDSVRQAVRDLVVEGLRLGRAPDALAREIQLVVGLDPRRSAAVEGLRARLESQGVQELVVERRVHLYSEALLRQRAQVIARTETIAASAAGQQELWLRAAAAGQIDPEKVVRVWRTAGDDRVDLKICEPLDFAEAPLDGPFPGGYMNPPVHPLCRCSVSLWFL